MGIRNRFMFPSEIQKSIILADIMFDQLQQDKTDIHNINIHTLKHLCKKLNLTRYYENCYDVFLILQARLPTTQLAY